LAKAAHLLRAVPAESQGVALERENVELRRANEILKKAVEYFAQVELERRVK